MWQTIGTCKGRSTVVVSGIKGGRVMDPDRWRKPYRVPRTPNDFNREQRLDPDETETEYKVRLVVAEEKGASKGVLGLRSLRTEQALYHVMDSGEVYELIERLLKMRTALMQAELEGGEVVRPENQPPKDVTVLVRRTFRLNGHGDLHD